MAPAETLFDQVVFSGGGLRCFWQGGFMHVLRHRRRIHPARVCGVSGGALSVVSFVADRGPVLLDRMMRAFAEQDSNVDLDAVAEGERITPHQRIYQRVVREVIDAEAERAVAEGPVCQIMIARPPGRAPALTGTLMTLAYEAELHLRSSPHFCWPQAVGLGQERVDARMAAREGRLAELVIAAATIPPVFAVPHWDGRPVVDAGMCDQAPMPEPDAGRTLVILTRKYRSVPDVPGRVYVEPSEAVPVDKIDFTDPLKLRQTWDQGERDAELFLESMN